MLFVLVAVATTIFSCKTEEDKHTPPDISFKTGTGYTSASAAVGQGDTVLIGIESDKTEDELKTLNESVAFDGATSTTTVETYTLTSAEEDHVEHDFTVIARMQAGTEKYTYTITDRDGNIAQVSLTLTVN
jgi:hypothetical protein